MQIQSIINPDCSKLGLIKASLNTKETSFHGFVDNHNYQVHPLTKISSYIEKTVTFFS